MYLPTTPGFYMRIRVAKYVLVYAETHSRSEKAKWMQLWYLCASVNIVIIIEQKIIRKIWKNLCKGRNDCRTYVCLCNWKSDNLSRVQIVACFHNGSISLNRVFKKNYSTWIVCHINSAFGYPYHIKHDLFNHEWSAIGFPNHIKHELYNYELLNKSGLCSAIDLIPNNCLRVCGSANTTSVCNSLK